MTNSTKAIDICFKINKMISSETEDVDVKKLEKLYVKLGVLTYNEWVRAWSKKS